MEKLFSEEGLQEEDGFLLMQKPQKLKIKDLHKQLYPNQRFSRPLLIGCSGGGGHNTAIVAIADYFYQSINLPRYIPTPYSAKPSSMLGAGIFFSSHFSQYEWWVSLENKLNLSVLPNRTKIMAAIGEFSLVSRIFSDMLCDAYPMGYESAAIWNILQREDQREELIKLLRLQSLNDSLCYRNVYDHYMTLLTQAYDRGQPYTELVSTQAMNLKALARVVIDYNKTHQPSVKIHQYLTDLPTVGAVHFSKALSRLTQEEQAQMHLYGVGLTHESLNVMLQSEYAFLNVYDIDPKDNPMIRPGFSDPGNDNSQNFYGRVMIDFDTLGVRYIASNEKIASIMLGSQAGNDSVRYIKPLIEAGMDRVFIFGGANLNIQREVTTLCSRDSSLMSKIVLLPNQSAPAMTQLLTRSQIQVIRGGGLSIIEQEAMNHHVNQKTIIHYPDSISENLSSGIPWEDCNADELIRYFQKSNRRIFKSTPNRVAHDLILIAQAQKPLSEVSSGDWTLLTQASAEASKAATIEPWRDWDLIETECTDAQLNATP